MLTQIREDARGEARQALRLEDYGISRSRGFLADFDPVQVALPGLLGPVVTAALELPRLLPTGRIRAHLAMLPVPDLRDFLTDGSDAAHRIAMLRYAFLVQAYVWGEPEPPRALPANLAVPIWQLADRLGQQPLLPYSSYALDNWGRFDPQEGFDLSNLHVIQSFLGGQDEAWFILIHVAIEAKAGQMLAQIPELIAAAAAGDESALASGLAVVSNTWDRVNAIFDRMPERCDPYIYYHRVRPWIHGWKDNPALPDGLVYAGVRETRGRPQPFRGQTGSQSSIVPVMDALLGVSHAADPLRSFLDELHVYRPPAHRRFIDDVRAASTLREVIAGARSECLTLLYNECVIKLARFRTRHLEYAASYIHRQSNGSAGNTSAVGTGGTPFMKYLKKHRGETEQALLPV